MDRSFLFLQINRREGKPRKRGLTEIHGPYYSVVRPAISPRCVQHNGRIYRFAEVRWWFIQLRPEEAVRSIVELCHKNDVLVSSGGFIERVLAHGSDAVRKYVAECKRIGFDIIEISRGVHLNSN
jgi:phosphosulfolactate synthase (CoM biosynthesis protein A)